MTGYEIQQKLNLQQIWIMSKKSLVKWVPGLEHQKQQQENFEYSFKIKNP